jgi:5'-3' exonuclease
MIIHIHDAMSSIRMRMESGREPPMMLLRGILNDAARKDRMTIWAWDGSGANDVRRQIYPGYKDRLPTNAQTYMRLQLVRQLLAHTNSWQARLNGFEGDDLVAALVDHFRPSGLPIEIITRDKDLSALCGGGVTTKAMIPGIPPHQVRLYKMCVGDKSDTLPGISGFGPKTWDAIEDKAGLEKLLKRSTPFDEQDQNQALALGLPKCVVNLLSKQEAIDDMNRQRRVIEPMPMTPEQFNAALSQGVDNPEAREAIMEKYLL